LQGAALFSYYNGFVSASDASESQKSDAIDHMTQVRDAFSHNFHDLYPLSPLDWQGHTLQMISQHCLPHLAEMDSFARQSGLFPSTLKGVQQAMQRIVKTLDTMLRLAQPQPDWP
jgi:hypothetical protein